MQSKVQAPAIGLMISSGLGLLWSLVLLAINLLGVGLSSAFSDIPNVEQMFSGTLGIASAVLGLLVQGVIFFGALKMKNLQSYGFSLASAILAVIPCLSPCPCCIFNFGIGLWALIMLLQSDVKQSFMGFQG